MNCLSECCSCLGENEEAQDFKLSTNNSKKKKKEEEYRTINFYSINEDINEPKDYTESFLVEKKLLTNMKTQMYPFPGKWRHILPYNKEICDTEQLNICNSLYLCRRKKEDREEDEIFIVDNNGKILSNTVSISKDDFQTDNEEYVEIAFSKGLAEKVKEIQEEIENNKYSNNRASKMNKNKINKVIENNNNIPQ